MAEYYLQHYGYVSSEPYLAHHGIKGQQWGVKHGPPYPLKDSVSRLVRRSRDNTDMAKKFNDYRDTAKTSKLIKDEQAIKESLASLRHLDKKESIQKSLNSVNPDVHGEGRNFNCQNSTTAFEMRRRGYDVTARRRDDGSNLGCMEKWFKGGNFTTVNAEKNAKDPFWNNSAKTKKWFAEANMSSPEYKKFYRQYRKRQRDAYRDFCNELMHQPVGSRGIWFVGWQMHLPPNYRPNPMQPMFYHAMNYRITKDGPIFYDSQSKRHKIIHNNEWDPYCVHPREYSYMRTDNLEPDPSIVEAVISRKG